MKRTFLCMAVVGICLLVFSNFSWAQCPEDPDDMGLCDTLHVVPYPETDTCFVSCYMGTCDTICINNPGEEFPCFLYVNLMVTHDSNTFWWAGGNRWVQDSIAAFVAPFTWTRTNPTAYCSLSSYWNENVLGWWLPQYPRSIWRHFSKLGSDSLNRYEWFAENGRAWGSQAVSVCTDSCVIPGGYLTPPHAFINATAVSQSAQKWWEGDRTLFATLTFTIQDTMHICIDTTFWPPGSNLSFTRYDAALYVPRDNVPLCIWVGPPRIEVVSPNGGETFGVGETHDITWVSEGFEDNVKIEYSTNSGTDWISIIGDTENDGVYSWIIPDTPSSQCRVRVADAVDGDPSDTSDSDFTISSPASITVTSPNGGEDWCAGSTQSITWTAAQITDVTIEFSVNGGVDWDTIVASTPNDGEYSWDIPSDLSTSTTCRVKISDLDGDPSDVSDADFTITGKSVEVASPVGGEVWFVDSTYDITWTSACVETVIIEYSTDGGLSFTVIDTTESDGSYSWQVPDAPSDSCRVKICDVDGAPCDTSDSNFTITLPAAITVTSPNGGENWCVGSTQSITWTAEQVTDVVIEYSVNGGVDWDTIVASTPNDGEYSWDIPSDLSTSTTCRVKVSDSDGDPSDVSDADFTITAKSLAVVSPNGAEVWIVDSTYDITWTSTCVETVVIGYSIDGGVNFAVIDTEESDGNYSWQIPDTPSDSCRVRICDAGGAPCDTSDADFSIVQPDFAIQVEPETLVVARGDSGEYFAVLTSLYGFSAACTLYVDGLPGGATGTFDPPTIDFATVDVDTSVLTVTVADTTTPDTFTLTITASEVAKQKEHTKDVVLIVPEPDFAMDVSPDTIEIYPDSTDSFRIDLTSLYGFASPCTLSATGLEGVGIYEFHPDTLTPTGVSYLVITDTTIHDGIYPVTIIATEMAKAAQVEHDTVVYLKVLPIYEFTVHADPDTQSVDPGDSTTFEVWLIQIIPTNGPCTLSVFNLPPGATGEFDPEVVDTDTSLLTIATADTTPEGEYTIIIEARYFQFRDSTEVLLVVQEQTDVEDEGDQLSTPDEFALFQNQPNPFNPETKISYYLSQGCEVQLTIYNILGRKVKTLFEGYQNAGMKSLSWDGRDDQGGQLGSGIYFYRLQAGTFNQTRKMTLIK